MNIKRICNYYLPFTIYLLPFILIFLSSCATQLTYYQNLKTLITTENYPKAYELVETNKMTEYGEKNALLYWMDKGIIAHYAGDYKASISHFDRAEKLAEELFTKSITEEAATFLTSDNARSFYGEDFERVFINVFQSLNYLLLGKYESALVEARKVDHKLKTLQVNYGHKNVYKEDAFMRYLMGLIYESQGAINDSFVSLRQALNMYEKDDKIYNFSIPADIITRSLKLANKLGFKDEYNEISNKYQTKYIPSKEKTGELIILHYNGFAPYKIDHFIEISFGEGWAYVGSVQIGTDDKSNVEKAERIARSIASEEQIVVAFPKYEISPKQIDYAEIFVYDSKGQKVGTTKTFITEDIETIAFKCLDDRIARIRIKAIARAAIKYALSKAIEGEVQKQTGDKLTQWLVKTSLKVASSATEKADKRSWRILPKEINLATKELPVGKYKLEINFCDKNKQVLLQKTIDNVEIEYNKKNFIIVRTTL